MVPQRGTASFISSIGHLDGRIDLCKTDNFGGVSGPHIHNKFNFSPALMDLCIMASKLVYENENVVKQIVVDHWKASILLPLSLFFLIPIHSAKIWSIAIPVNTW